MSQNVYLLEVSLMVSDIFSKIICFPHMIRIYGFPGVSEFEMGLVIPIHLSSRSSTQIYGWFPSSYPSREV